MKYVFIEKKFNFFFQLVFKATILIFNLFILKNLNIWNKMNKNYMDKFMS